MTTPFRCSSPLGSLRFLDAELSLRRCLGFAVPFVFSQKHRKVLWAYQIMVGIMFIDTNKVGARRVQVAWVAVCRPPTR